mgnify:CR=1 FL=1
MRRRGCEEASHQETFLFGTKGRSLTKKECNTKKRECYTGATWLHCSLATLPFTEATSLHKDLCEKIATLSFSEQLDCEHWFLPCPVCGKRRCCKCLIGFAIYQGDPPSCRCERPSRRSQRLRTRLESTTTVWQDPAAALKSAFPELY